MGFAMQVSTVRMRECHGTLIAHKRLLPRVTIHVRIQRVLARESAIAELALETRVARDVASDVHVLVCRVETGQALEANLVVPQLHVIDELLASRVRQEI